MQRLNTVLPDWTRVQWTSIENKNKYEPILSSISSAWKHIERMSVVHDIRSSTLDIINSDELSTLIEEYKQYVEAQRLSSLAIALDALRKSNAMLENNFNLSDEEK